MARTRIAIRMESYDHEILDDAAGRIAHTATESGARIAGPVPMPTRIERITVNRSPFVDKKSREQFEIRTHKRVIFIYDSTPKTMEQLSRLNIPAGVEFRIIEKAR